MVVVVRTAVAALLLIACHARNPAFCPDGEDSDGACLGDGTACFGVAPFVVCVAPPEEPRTLTGVDTTLGCDEVVTVGRELCVVTGTDVTILQRVPVTGARPLVILASNALTIEGNGIVEAVGTDGSSGPGADLACDASATAGKDNSGGGGGGAGGSFGSRGGNGGDGKNTPGTRGTAGIEAGAPTMLQGGCSGTNGGDGDDPGTGGARGFGGGGLYLVAGETLTIRGIVNASGAGGRGGKLPKGGGGGGGSGGMIVLHAPAIDVMTWTRIFANGGGGGNGAKGGDDGMDGEAPIEPQTAAKGGLGQGGAGGDGAFLTNAAGMGMTFGDGGGGGGGGGGVIYVLGDGDLGAANVSPPLATPPR